MGCQLCAGAAATEALKILLKRGKVLAAPHGTISMPTATSSCIPGVPAATATRCNGWQGHHQRRRAAQGA
jgi:hypothetical protein